MFPALSLLQIVPCRESGLGACECAANTCCFAEQGPPRILSCQGDLSEPQELVPGRNFLCNALAISSDGSVVLAGGHVAQGALLLRVALSEPQAAIQVALPAHCGGEPLTSITHVVKAADDVYAVAADSYVYTVDGAGNVTQSLDPLADEVLDVRWAGRGGALVALTSSGVHVWPRGGADGTSLTIPCPDGAMTALAASPAASWVAAACTSCTLRCWAVERLVAAAETGDPPPSPLILGSYDGPVRCLQWDGRGRYLATADGADCTVWDMSSVSAAAAAASASQEAVEVDDADSVMCCGHDPATHITSLAFQPGGRLLATISNSGRLALFDARGFRRGGVAGPHATASIGEDVPAAGEGAARLAWLPGGRLLLSIPGSESLVCYAVGAAEGAGREGVLSPSGSVGMDSEKESGSTALTQACTSVEYTSSPLTPAQGSGEATELFEEECGNGSNAMALASVAEVEGEAAEGGGEALPAVAAPEPAAVAQPAAEAGAQMKGVEGEAEPRTRPAPKPIRTSSRRVDEAPPLLQRPAAVPPLAVFEGEGGAARSARTRSGRRGGSTSGSASGSTSARGGGMSASDAALLEHIQQLREAPAIDRNDQGEELTGWGLGMMGGAAPAAPWAAGQPPAGGVPQAMAFAPGYGAVPMQYMQYPQYQQAMLNQQAAMMNAAAAAAAQGMTSPMAGMQAIPLSPHAAGAGAYAAASPRASGAGMMVPASWGAVPAPGYARQAQHAMQAQQQWAGVAPGYMTYQHGVTAYGMAGGGPPGVMHAAAAGAGPQPAMAYSPSAPRQFSGGTGSPMSGSAFSAAMAAQNNADSGPDSARSAGGRGASTAGATTERQHSESEAAEASNNDLGPSGGGSRRRRQRGGGGGGSSKGSGSSGLSSAAADAAMAAVAAAAAAREPRPPPAPAPPALSSPAAPSSPRRRPATVPLPPQPDPESDSDVSATIYLGHLPPAVDEHVLAWTCAHFGPVAHAQVIRDKATHVSRGYGFVTFAHPAYATVAMQQLNGQVMWGPFGGQRIRVAPTNKRAMGDGVPPPPPPGASPHATGVAP